MTRSSDIAVLLDTWRHGDRAALQRLLPLVYSEAARVLDFSPSTVKRELRTAKAWLAQELGYGERRE
jgi:DNA-directed RNA polymerase specialized sigma24 family protein